MSHFITRRQKLLETLMAHDDWCTATELASRLGGGLPGKSEDLQIGFFRCKMENHCR